MCASANEWNEEKLKRLPTLLRGRAWAVYDVLGERQTDTYAHLKTALLKRLSPDTEEDRLSAREELAKRRLREEQESVDELAHDLEKLLDRASPGLPAEIRDSELRFHLINALPEKVAFQLKLLPKLEYGDTIPKARELLLIYRRAENPVNPVNQVEVEHRGDRLERLEETILQVSQQLAALGASRPKAAETGRCFKCNRPGHLAKDCRSSTVSEIECFRCGGRGHVVRQCPTQGNFKGGVPTR